MARSSPLTALLALGLALTACEGAGLSERPTSAPVAPTAVPAEAEPFTVSRVVDGDTFKAEDLAPLADDGNSSADSVRLWGIDAPERGDKPAGPDATAWLRGAVEDADRRLFCERKDVDRYGRLVARCYLPDGQDVQAAMIADGHALEWCRYSDGAFGQCGVRGGRSRR